MKDSNQVMIVAVHDGGFHADDVFSITILKLIFPGLSIVRTRDEDRLKKADMRVDVGRKYSIATNDFDHHQNDFKEKRKNNMPYSSAGLIWKHFGERLVNSKEAFDYIDKIIQQVDAADCGYKACKNDCYNFNDLTEAFMPNWKDEDKSFDEAFNEAVGFISTLLRKEIHLANSLKEAKELIKKSMTDKDYIVLETVINRWRDLILDFPSIKFVITHGSQGSWCSESTRVKENSFEVKKKFPSGWADLTAERLSSLTGVEDAIYCHKKRFIAVARSKEGAIKLTELALKD